MWPFNKNKKKEQLQQDEGPKVLILVRYTYDAFKKVFPNKSDAQWEEVNSPNDISTFVKHNVAQSQIKMCTFIESVQIATIDDNYLLWAMERNIDDLQVGVRLYVQEHINDEKYWDERLIESGMTDSYNVLGIPSMFVVGNIIGNKTECILTQESINELTEKISNIYSSENVFVPGWITKGSDMPAYVSDIAQIAEESWNHNKSIRFGKYMEQIYGEKELSDKFNPLYFVVPFLIKIKINRAKIDLFSKDESANNLNSMAGISFSSEQRTELLKIIRDSVKEVVSIGPSAVLPGQAYISYNVSLSKNKDFGKILFNF